MKILDVGCGLNKESGAVGIDFNPNSQADVVHNLNSYPWPLPESSFDKIICRHIIEHVDDVISFMNEIHRIGKPGCQVEIVTPHFTNPCSYWDPTHKRYLSLFSFNYFLAEEETKPSFFSRLLETKFAVPSFYTKKRFKKLKRKLTFGRPYRWLGLQLLANRFPYFYEFYLAPVFSARDIYVTLEVIK